MVDMATVGMHRQRDLIGLIRHPVDAAGLHAHQFALGGVELVPDFEFGVIRPAAVVDTVVADIVLDALDPRDHGPGTMIVRWRAAAG